ncbi:efflux RND transporter periplasmic adaptor subunit [Roseimaritima ulvae]|uniref:Multidrug resistance protein MdtA n=1 Tax=Roseimaritima ulvae TaxID=980254 RepID=A0A5B9QRR6_9BACT|nr:efflux RND transporter periplasmic adaptor subunit [Roseimaritima ulvae]QEG40035.1 Multidrug resistance protein MdtA precursor [Roseimaritima ulvae]
MMQNGQSNIAMQTPAILLHLHRPLLLIATLLLCAGCGAEPKQEVRPTAGKQETLKADVYTVTRKSWPAIVRSQGSLHADEESVVGAKVAGRVAKVHVDLGDFVEVGTPIVTLDREEFVLQLSQAEAQLQQARAAVGLRSDDAVADLSPENSPPVREQRAIWEQAKSDVTRAESLRNQSAIAEGEYDQVVAAERVAEARYASAINSVHEKIATIGVREAEASLARQQLHDSIIVAPLDGLIQQREVAIGSYVQAGQAIAKVVRNHPLRFRGTVPERFAQALRVGQEVELQLESIATPLTTQVTRISPILDQRSRALMFEAEVDNSDRQIRTGLFAEAALVIDPEATAVVIPESAIVEFAGTQKVWKVVDGMAGEQQVLVGGRRDDQLEIIEGLEVDDVILLDGSKGRVAKVIPASPQLANLDRSFP